jgi:putative transposase
MRCVKRQTVPLNVGKESALQDLCRAYAREKQHWFSLLQSNHFQALLGNHRRIRDHFVKEGYQSVSGLQARHWKLALQDAVETWDKYWQSLFVKIRFKISKRCFKDNESRYAYFLIKDYEQFAALMRGDIPDAPFELKEESKRQIAGYVRRLVKHFKGKAPVVKKTRTVKFDADCYDTFEHEGRQYIKLMSLEKGKRIILPLEGKSTIKGNLTIVLSKEGIHVHTSQELREKTPSSQNEVAVDLGYTEVMTDQEGERYGEGFGKILTEKSDSANRKNQQRNKLYALKKKYSCIKKREHIRKYNLGRKKFTRKKEKWQAQVNGKINQAIHQLIRTKRPSTLITEDLSHLFTYKKSATLNRRLSSWLRGEIQNRISFKALAEGFRHEQVNPAYGSQTCPKCDFVDQKNRILDKFTCLYCRHEDMADRVAAQNYAKRFGDQEITLYTPYREVKTILLDRFHRRLEEEKSSLFRAGLEKPYQGMHPPSPVEMINVIAGRESSRQNRAVNPRAKQNKYV